MTESYSHLKSHRNSTSKQKVSRQLFVDSSLLSNNKKNNRMTQNDDHHNIIQANTQTSRQFCKAYKKQTTQNSQQKSKIKNQQSSDYIRNLYKKYLGKQNNIQTHSQRKLRTDIKQDKKTLVTQTCRDSEGNNTSSRKQKISSIFQESRKDQRPNFFKKQYEKNELNRIVRDSITPIEVNINPLDLNREFYEKEKKVNINQSKPPQIKRQAKKDWYSSLLSDDFALNLIESEGSSILTALKNIKTYKSTAKN